MLHVDEGLNLPRQTSRNTPFFCKWCINAR